MSNIEVPVTLASWPSVSVTDVVENESTMVRWMDLDAERRIIAIE